MTATLPTSAETDTKDPPDRPAPTSEHAGGKRGVGRRSAAHLTAVWMRNIGAIALLFVAYQLWVTGLAEHRYQTTLRREFDASLHRPIGTAVTPGQAVAHLQIPGIHLDQYVVEGTGRRELDAGPGHFAGSPLPGQAGAVVVSGHRTTFGGPFRHLDRLTPGDAITLTTPAGRFRYTVAGPPVVLASAGTAEVGGAANRLELVTCTPTYAATDRLVVVASLVGPPLAGSSPGLAGRGGAPVDSGWGWGHLPGTVLCVGGLIGLALGAGRLRLWCGRLGGWVISGPIWLAGLLLVFQNLRLLLPANL